MDWEKSSRNALALIAAMAFHALILFLLTVQKVEPPEKRKPPVTINLVSRSKILEGKESRRTPKRSSEPAQEPKASPQKSQTKVLPHQNSTLATEKPRSTGSPSGPYGHLLPTQSEITPSAYSNPKASGDGLSSSKHVWAEGTTREGKQSLLRIAGQVNESFDIPLAVRLIGERGSATADIRVKNHAFVLKSLYGLPILRAALYESFQK